MLRTKGNLVSTNNLLKRIVCFWRKILARSQLLIHAIRIIIVNERHDIITLKVCYEIVISARRNCETRYLQCVSAQKVDTLVSPPPPYGKNGKKCQKKNWARYVGCEQDLLCPPPPPLFFENPGSAPDLSERKTSRYYDLKACYARHLTSRLISRPDSFVLR